MQIWYPGRTSARSVARRSEIVRDTRNTHAVLARGYRGHHVHIALRGGTLCDHSDLPYVAGRPTLASSLVGQERYKYDVPVCGTNESTYSSRCCLPHWIMTVQSRRQAPVLQVHCAMLCIRRRFTIVRWRERLFTLQSTPALNPLAKLKKEGQGLVFTFTCRRPTSTQYPQGDTFS